MESTKIGAFLKESRVPGSPGNIARKITVKLYGKGVFAKQENRPGSENTMYYARRAGQFIYSKLDFLNGAFGIIPDNLDGFETTVDLPCFDFVGDRVAPDWFLQYVSRPDFYAYQGGLGNGGRKARRISPDDFLELEIDLPPLPEQKKIAEIFSGIDRLVQAKKRRAKQRKLLLKSAFEDATKKGASDDFVPLSDLGHWRGGGTPSKSIPEYWGGAIPWVSPKDMKGRKISCSQDSITQEALENSTTSLIPKDSILFVVRSGILRHTFPIAMATREVAINQDLNEVVWLFWTAPIVNL